MIKLNVHGFWSRDNIYSGQISLSNACETSSILLLCVCHCTADIKNSLHQGLSLPVTDTENPWWNAKLYLIETLDIMKS